VKRTPTIRFVLDFFPDGRYMLLLLTRTDYKNVRLHEDGSLTICLTEEDLFSLKELPRLYSDVNDLNSRLKQK
jgi:hypothetical protein